jgi:hypothetical protein
VVDNLPAKFLLQFQVYFHDIPDEVIENLVGSLLFYSHMYSPTVTMASSNIIFVLSSNALISTNFMTLLFHSVTLYPVVD